jgi:hypothetical protein
MARADTEDEREQETSNHDQSDKRDGDSSETRSSDGHRSEGPDGGRQRPKKRLPGLQVFERSKEQLEVITGRSSDSVSAFSPSDEGWDLTIEMIEVEKIPPTTNVMASYHVEVDDEGNILEYQLASRYIKGQPGEQS